METDGYQFVPFVRKWDGHDHAHFLKWAFDQCHLNLYFYKHWRESHENYKKRVAEERYSKLGKLYRLGRFLHVLDVDYETFDRKMGEGTSYRAAYGSYGWRFGYRRGKTYKDFYPRKGAHYRQKIPLRITEKKTVSPEEQQKREWKASKGKRRRNCWRSCNRKTYAKLVSNRCYRRYEKREIQAERYENIFKEKRKDYFDPWDWD